MAIVVQKYGGKSLADSSQIKVIAARIVDRYLAGDSIVVVVSANGGNTDNFLNMANTLSKDPDKRELDLLLSVGERISISLMSLAINEIKPSLARAFTGSQIGLITDCNHGEAKILEIKGDPLKECIKLNKIAVIAGFQGVSTQKQVTTLGRGGSDTTAIAVAAVLEADSCEIYSDFDGIFTADPRLLPSAKLISRLDYGTMLSAANLGSKVLKEEAVAYAQKLGVTIKAGNSSTGYCGTIITDKQLLDEKNSTILNYQENWRCTEIENMEGVLEYKGFSWINQAGSCQCLYQVADQLSSNTCCLSFCSSFLNIERARFLDKLVRKVNNNIILRNFGEGILLYYLKGKISEKELKILHSNIN